MKISRRLLLDLNRSNQSHMMFLEKTDELFRIGDVLDGFRSIKRVQHGHTRTDELKSAAVDRSGNHQCRGISHCGKDSSR